MIDSPVQITKERKYSFPFAWRTCRKQIPNRGFAAGEAVFDHQPLINPTRCVTLLFKPLPIIFIKLQK